MPSHGNAQPAHVQLLPTLKKLTDRLSLNNDSTQSVSLCLISD